MLPRLAAPVAPPGCFPAMEPGTFVWQDLASDDVERAAAFYAAMFGWQSRTARANGGVFHRLSLGGRDIASLYRIGEAARMRGMRPHWTSYICVPSVDEAAARAAANGGAVLVRPLDIGAPGVHRHARIALIGDPDRAVLGLWEGPSPAS